MDADSFKKAKHFNAMWITHAGRLSGKMVEDSAAVFSSKIGVHQQLP
jgi:hypothetical protein